MARKGQVSLQDSVETDEEFEAYIEAHSHQLICVEVYSEFCGPCGSTTNALKKAKLEIGMDDIALVKGGKQTRLMFGANGIELCRLVELELESWRAGGPVQKYEIHEMLPIEAEKLEEELRLEAEHKEAEDRLKALILAARKKRVCERMAADLSRLNFVMYWPLHHQAHVDMYERYDKAGIQVAAKDFFQLTEETIEEALYMSDVEPNAACVHGLITGKVLVAAFKMDSDTKDIMKLMRYILYEEIPEPKEDVPQEKQLPPIPAFERYAAISKTAREVRRERYEAKMAQLRKEQEERDRLAAEQARLARQAEEERLAEEKRKAEEQRMARLQQGLPEEPEPEEVEEEGEEEEGEEEEETEGKTATESEIPPSEPEPEPEPVEEEFHSDVEVEGEDYIPPGGLFVPGLYCPNNVLAKNNGLTFFFPKLIAPITKIEASKLPPHVLVMFNVDKRYDVQEIVNTYIDEIFNIGIFKGDDPYTAEHVAYTIKQYDRMTRYMKHHDRLAVMVSRKRSLPLLQLAGLNPCYISHDTQSGERECVKLFPVGYGDDYVEQESLKEENVPVVVEPQVESTHVIDEEVSQVQEEQEEEVEEEEEDV